MVKDRVLIVSETQEGAEKLRTRLFEAAKQVIPSEGGAVLTIKTKYFTVNVEVIVCARTGLNDTAERERIDALILDDLECANSELETMLQLFETQPGVTLLCCQREARKIDEKTEEALRMWCIDHDTEFIDMGLQTVSEREKEGIDRVFEALSSYPWQMDMNEDCINVNPGLAGMGFDDNTSSDTVPSLDSVPMTIPSSAEKTTEKVVKKDKEEEKKKTEEKEVEDDDAVEEATIEKFCEDLLGGNKEDDELESDDFLQLMEKLSMMRNAAQKMPDAQRRQYAEQVAMAFARQLAFEDEEDEDDEEEVKHQEQDHKAAKEFDDEIQRIFTQMNQTESSSQPRKSSK